MTKIIKQKLWLKALILILPIGLFCSVMLLKDTIVKLAALVPKCLFYQVVHVACPGCGNTRSVFALLNFDILSSLRFNLFPILFIIIGGMLYLELIFYSFGKKVVIFPRKNYVIYIILGVMLLYYIVRIFVPFLKL